jgi:SM-20-related protein
MHALMDETHHQELAPLELSAALGTSGMSSNFKKRFASHIENVLSPTSALALYEHVAQEVEWRSFLVAKETMFAGGEEHHGVYPPELEKEMSGCAYEGAASGFACFYDANRLFEEDIPSDACMENVAQTPFFLRLNDFVNSQEFLDFMRSVTGLQRIGRAAIRATRFRSGHFEMFHASTQSGDRTGKRVASFNINLTPEWKPEWGGLLEFRRQYAGTIEAFVPTFNSLDIVAFPMGYWISSVAPFAGTARLAISGRLYVH